MGELVKVNYPVEQLGDYEDDGTMVASKEALEEAVVGHRIVRAEEQIVRDRWSDRGRAFVITLDTGKKVIMRGGGDCCAYTELENFLLHADKIDHIITGVGTTEGYTKWHIFADMGDVLELEVGWSCGNPFYYGYGFDVTVQDIENVIDAEVVEPAIEKGAA